MLAFFHGYQDKDSVIHEQSSTRTSDIYHMARILLKYKDDFMVDDWDTMILRGELALTDTDAEGDAFVMGVWSDDREERAALLAMIERLESEGE